MWALLRDGAVLTRRRRPRHEDLPKAGSPALPTEQRAINKNVPYIQ